MDYRHIFHFLGWFEHMTLQIWGDLILFTVVKVFRYLWFFASRWTHTALIFFQIHEKLHYYEKQSPVPILHGAAALADDVSVPFLIPSRTYPVAGRCVWPLSERWKKSQMFPKSLSSPSMCWCCVDSYPLSFSKFVPEAILVLCLGDYVIEIVGFKFYAVKSCLASVFCESHTRRMLWRNKDKWDSYIADSTKNDRY